MEGSFIMATRSIVHVEYSANNPEEAARFYTELFGWNIQKTPEFNYWTFAMPDGSGGGGFNPIGNNGPTENGFEVKPGTVITYISSDDIEADLARAEELGAKTVTPKMEIPGIGWFGLFTDPSGNMIGLFTANPAFDPTRQPEAVGAAS